MLHAAIHIHLHSYICQLLLLSQHTIYLLYLFSTLFLCNANILIQEGGSSLCSVSDFPANLFPTLLSVTPFLRQFLFPSGTLVVPQISGSPGSQEDTWLFIAQQTLMFLAACYLGGFNHCFINLLIYKYTENSYMGRC